MVRRDVLLAALSGALLALSFPKFGHPACAWIALVPVALFIARSGTLRRAFLGGFLCGAVQFFPLLIDARVAVQAGDDGVDDVVVDKQATEADQ